MMVIIAPLRTEVRDWRLEAAGSGLESNENAGQRIGCAHASKLGCRASALSSVDSRDWGGSQAEKGEWTSCDAVQIG